MRIKSIFLMLFLNLFLFSSLASAELEEDKSLRIKRAFYEATGVHWYDATKEEREQFFKELTE
ncbi:MAG: hypothetical protein KC618_07770, partial [Candidatus Omnitrophica bacterium]|nr:hypothetical protein [Candidatus Omnitrophota bacterium]